MQDRSRRWLRGLALFVAVAAVWGLASLTSLASLAGLQTSTASEAFTAAAESRPVPAPDVPGSSAAAPVWPAGEIERPAPPWTWVRLPSRAPLPPSPDWKVTAGEKAAGSVLVGVAAPAEVSLGDRLDYTLVVTNDSGTGATVQLDDILPLPTSDEQVLCDPACERRVDVVIATITTPGRYGAQPYTETITMTYQVRWPGIWLPNGTSSMVQFSFPIVGLDDGAMLTNRGYIKYTLDNNDTGTGMSAEVETTVRVPVVAGDQVGMSDVPVWRSDDYGGSGSVDWGDYDRDGSLDLALAGTTGTTVYHNQDGRLYRLWSSNRYSHEARWIEIDGDGILELVSIGYNWWTGEIDNHVYHLRAGGDRFEEVEATALEEVPLLRVEPADMDGDGDMDLVAVTYALWTTDSCTFRLYANDGSWPPWSGPYRCLATPDLDYDKITENLLSLGDYDNDDALDVVGDLYDLNNTDPGMPCSYRDVLWLFPNRGGSLTATQPITIDLFTRCNFPEDVDWGDYDGDGDLDLAAAVPALTSPNEDQVRIYRNMWVEGGTAAFAPPIILTQPHDQPPFALQWADFNGDGLLDLIVGAMPFRVYINRGGTFSQDQFLGPPVRPARGFALDLAVADYDNDTDIDVATANPLAPSALYSTFASRLSPSLSAIASWSSSSVAWGDANADGTLDLLFGAGADAVNAALYLNVDGLFPSNNRFSATGFGPHSTAFGDVDHDGKLEIAISTAAEIQVYQAENINQPPWRSSAGIVANTLAWGDADDDGDLDLAAGTGDAVLIFENVAGSLSAEPVWTAAVDGGVSSIAWANVDSDHYLDLIVGRNGQPSELYHNEADGTFSVTWTSPGLWNTTSLALGDYDADGDPDLALGNDGQPNVIYENEGGTFGTTPVWTSAEVSRTTSVAWGDWNNDGDLDLAVGNYDQPNQVYLNRGSRPGTPRLLYLWRSADLLPTTGVAWGDLDSDGDLDLAISSETRIGLYKNNSIVPSHLVDDFVPTAPLPDNQSYLFVERPGTTPAAYFYSSPGLLSGPDYPTVTIHYRAFDADGTRHTARSDEPGDQIASALFEYSVNGGGTWQTATPAAGSPAPPTTTLRLGQDAQFVWNALADAAIGDDARFRVSLVSLTPAGPVQHALARAVSPPFRVRGTTCIWPIHPTIGEIEQPLDVNKSAFFAGAVAQASGILTFTWDFGDGTTGRGQVVAHHFHANNTYTVRLTITSEPCPVAKVLKVQKEIVVGTGIPDTYLPIIVKPSASGG